MYVEVLKLKTIDYDLFTTKTFDILIVISPDRSLSGIWSSLEERRNNAKIA